jgi:hypothetical protein
MKRKLAGQKGRSKPETGGQMRKKTTIAIAIVASWAASGSASANCDTTTDPLLAAGCAAMAGDIREAEALLNESASLSGQPGPIVFNRESREFWRSYLSGTVGDHPDDWPKFLCPSRTPLCYGWHFRALEMLAARAADIHDDDDDDRDTPVVIPSDWYTRIEQARDVVNHWIMPVVGPTIKEALEPGYTPRTPEGQAAGVGRALAVPAPLPSEFSRTFFATAASGLSPESYQLLAEAVIDIAVRWEAEREAGNRWETKPGPATVKLDDWATESPVDPQPEPSKALWSFVKLTSGNPGESPVVEKVIQVDGLGAFSWSGTYSFRSMALQRERWSYALFYLTGAPPRDWEKAIAYCHLRNGRQQRQQYLACVVGAGKWSGKPKKAVRLGSPVLPGQSVRLTMSYSRSEFTAVLEVESRNLASVKIAPRKGLPPVDVRRIQLGHPQNGEWPDLPSHVVITDGRLER